MDCLLCVLSQVWQHVFSLSYHINATNLKRIFPLFFGATLEVQPVANQMIIAYAYEIA